MNIKNIFNVLQNAGLPQTQYKFGNLPYIMSIFAYILWPIAWIYCNQSKVSFAQSTLSRGIVTLIMSYIACQFTIDKDQLKYGQNYKLLLIRSIVMTLHSLFTGLSQFILPLPITHTIGSSGTIFIFVIDYLMNGTRINIKQGIGIVIGLFGVFLTTNGELITKFFDKDYKQKTKFENYITDDLFIITVFSFFYCIVVILWAYGVVITRMSKSNTFQINFILGLAFYFIGIACLPYMPSLGYTPITFTNLLYSILLTGFPCFMVQILAITALTMTKQTGILNIINFTSILVSYLISIFFYQQTPNLLCFFGVTLVIFGLVKTIISTQKK